MASATPRNEVMPNNTSEECIVSVEGYPANQMPNTPEQIQDAIKLNNTNEDTVVSIEGSLAKDMSNTLMQILDALRGSEERDDNLKFWAMYNKVSNEYDYDLVGRADDDMGNILTCAAIFAAVNSTFIVGTQPNPGDTTNVLLLHLIQISVNGSNSVPDINTLSSYTGFSSLTVWIQTLAYASLAFSVLAAFGAVLGKQWLHSYMANRGRGTLEERGMRRQMKLDGVEYFRLRAVLQTFLVLLQISFLLFGLSLSANVWVKQTKISSVVICTTAFGILFYVGIILMSALCPDSPFQTPGPGLFTAICQKIIPKTFRSTRNTGRFAKSSAIRWILETLTNPEVVEAAAMIVPRVQWPPSLDVSTVFARLRRHFMACRDTDKEELYVKYGKAMAHLCIQSGKISRGLLEFYSDNKFQTAQSRLVHDAFMAGRAAYNQFKKSWAEDAKPKHRASARTALRTMLVHGLSFRLSCPDDEELIWRGDLQWRCSDGHTPSCEEFDWLVDYLADGAEYPTDDETEGDALLALSAMRGLGSSTRRLSYIRSLIRCMDSPRPPRVRHSALRAVFEAREELASIASVSMSQDDDAELLNTLSRALLTAVRPDDRIIHDTGPDASYHFDRDNCYIRIIYDLTKKDEWCKRLIHDDHLAQCISLVDGNHLRCSDARFYLLKIFGHVMSSGKDLPFSPAEERWRQLIADAWDFARYVEMDDDYVDGIPALVTATRLNLTTSCGVPRKWFADLHANVHTVLVDLQERQAILADDGVAQVAVDVVLLSSMRDLCDDLRPMTEDQNALQRDDRQATAGESSIQHRSGFQQALQKFKNVTKKVSCSDHQTPAVRDVNLQGAPSNQNIEDVLLLHTSDSGKPTTSASENQIGRVNQGASGEPASKVLAAPSGVEEIPESQLVDAQLRDAVKGVEGMRLLGGRVTSVVSAASDAPANLAAADDFQATYLQPLKIFDSAIENIVDVHPYAKMALGMLSAASKVFPRAQTKRDQSVLSLLKKLEEVYRFISQDDIPSRISSERSILEQIVQQTLECACFIRDYSKKKSPRMVFGGNVLKTDDLIARYNKILDELMQQLVQLRLTQANEVMHTVVALGPSVSS